MHQNKDKPSSSRPTQRDERQAETHLRVERGEHVQQQESEPDHTWFGGGANSTCSLFIEKIKYRGWKIILTRALKNTAISSNYTNERIVIKIAIELDRPI